MEKIEPNHNKKVNSDEKEGKEEKEDLINYKVIESCRLKILNA
jgi:hypothetical protein